VTTRWSLRRLRPLLAQRQAVFTYNCLIRSDSLGRGLGIKRVTYSVRRSRRASTRWYRLQYAGPVRKGGTGVFTVDGKEMPRRRSRTRFRCSVD